MGYGIMTTCSEFEIRKENFPKLIELARKNCDKFDLAIDFFDRKMEELLSERLIRELFDDHIGIEVSFFEGNLQIHSCGSKLMNQEAFLTAIAPAVEPDSYVEISGEDGTLWRWVFKHKKLHDIQPTWPEVVEGSDEKES